MPPRLQLLKKRYSTIDLPILPFLAPRVFEPWPSSRCKSTAGTKTARNHSMLASLDYSYDAENRHESRKVLDSLHLGDQQQGERSRARTGDDARNIHSRLDSGKPLLKESGLLRNGTTQFFRISPALHKPLHKHSIGGSSEQQSNKASQKRLLEPRSPMKSMRRLKTGPIRPRRVYIPVKQRPSSTSIEPQQSSGKTRENGMSGDLLLRRRRGSGNLRKNLESEPSLTGKMESDLGLNHSAMLVRKPRSPTLTHLLTSQGWTHPRTRRLRSGKPPHWSREISSLVATRKWHGLMLSLEHIRPGMIDSKRSRKGDPSISLTYQSDIDKMLQLESIEGLRELWLALPFHQRMVVWPELMVATLAHHPERAFQILEATYTTEIPHLYVMDTLHCIITHLLRKPECPPQDFVLNLTNSIRSLLFRSLPRVPPGLSQASIYLLLRSLPETSLKEFYLTLTKLKSRLSNNTLIQLASRLAKGGETDLAFDMLHRLKDVKELDTPKILSLCTTMLQKSQLNSNAQHRESDIFRFIQECGLTPNIITYNVLILNAIKDGNSETAWKLHDMIVDTGIEADEFTYSILLNDAKWRMDSSAMETVMDIVSKRRFNNAHIFTDVLHAIHLLSFVSDGRPSETTQDLGAVFERMLQVYCEHFHIEPLVRMIPQLSGFISPPSDPEIVKDLMVPAHATITVMLTGFLHFSQASHAYGWYAYFRDLVASGDPIVEDLIKDTHIYNVILMTFRRHRELRNEAPKIIADMLAPTEESEDATITSRDQTNTPKTNNSNLEAQLRRPHTPPKPDVFAWTILLQTFMIQQHPRAAEKVLAMMVRRGVKPDLITWNSLVKGYSRLQDVNRTADSVRRLEAAGFKPDDNTYRLLGGVGDRNALSKALGEKKIVVESNFMEQLGQEVIASEVEKRMRMREETY